MPGRTDAHDHYAHPDEHGDLMAHDQHDDQPVTVEDLLDLNDRVWRARHPERVAFDRSHIDATEDVVKSFHRIRNALDWFNVLTPDERAIFDRRTRTHRD